MFISEFKTSDNFSFAFRVLFSIIAVCVFSCIYSFVIGYINNFVADKDYLLFLLPLGCFCIFMMKSFELNNTFFKVISAWISHFVGASVGKEGVGLLLGRSISGHFFAKEDDDIPVIIGTSSAFAALFVSPLAGAVFTFESALCCKKMKAWHYLIALLSSLISCIMAKSLGVHAFRFVKLSVSDFNMKSLYMSLISACVVFVVTMIYTKIKAEFKKRKLSENYKASLLISLVILILSLVVFRVVGNRYVNSLSIQLLSDFSTMPAFRIIAVYIVAKAILTLLSISSGFAGGEFVPLVVIGAYCGLGVCNLFGTISPLAISISAYCALCFGLRVPLTSLVLEAELIALSLLGL